MQFHEKVITGVFRDRALAQRCYDVLLGRGFTDDRFNLIMSEQTRSMYVDPLIEERNGIVTAQRARAATHETRAAEGVGVGGAIGTAIGGSLAAIAALGTSLIIPGLNLVVAGPLLAALAGGGAGAITGGMIGGLVGLGIPEDRAETYNKAVREGCTVLAVTLHAGDDAGEVKEIMESCSAENVHSS